MALIDWRDAPDLLAEILRQHGQTPGAITDTRAVWAAFAEFAQTKLNGIAIQPNSDSDGFILQWGRWSWSGHRPSMSFIRQVAVPRDDDQFGSVVAHWQIELVLFYEESAVLSLHPNQDTGFYFPTCNDEWRAALMEAQDFPPFQAVIESAPVGNSLTLEPAD
ncbi:hypothetical protein [Microbispora hainanensis]|uniref:Uncharacterized protein n=1 Tax=Microbispora hainanensis TaxID=568844 RepID=A0A544YV89_9ACTN|nr:hypothetical protein [Microbispora hainanensis]TQS20677.1 hypothetical protein FLX08_14405 [Microbispora hainanensis]